MLLNQRGSQLPRQLLQNGNESVANHIEKSPPKQLFVFTQSKDVFYSPSDTSRRLLPCVEITSPRNSGSSNVFVLCDLDWNGGDREVGDSMTALPAMIAAGTHPQVR